MKVALQVAAVTLALLLSGCESAQKAGGMNDAINDYHAMRYSQAHQKSVAVQDRSTKPGEKENAAYVAGLAAYQLGQFDEAEVRFMTASRSSDPQTAARSKAMLGQLRLDQGRPRDAAALFIEAQPHLDEEDARKCAHNAAVAYQRAGDLAAARRWAGQSGTSISVGRASNPSPSAATTSASHSPASSGSPTLGSPIARNTPPAPTTGSRASASPSTAGTGFTLQVGAFRERKHAQSAAEEAQKLISREGLGPVRIITRKDERGSTLHVVQFGHFPTREAAAAARAKLGRLNYIVAPLSST